MENKEHLEETEVEDEPEKPNQGATELKKIMCISETPDIKENLNRSSLTQSNKCEMKGAVKPAQGRRWRWSPSTFTDPSRIKKEDNNIKQERTENMDGKAELQVELKEENALLDIKKSEFKLSVQRGPQEIDMIRAARKFHIISRKAEPGSNRFVCSICGKREKCTNSVKTHLMKEHNHIEPPFQQVVRECNKCEFTSGQIINVVRHMANVHNSTELYSRCHLCDYQSERSYDVKHHIRITHLKMNVKCEQCGFTAARQYDIRRHVQTVHDGIPAKCTLCSFTSLTISTIYSHRIRYHTEKSCKECHETFKGTINLVEHKLRNHLGKVIDCNKCDYKSTNKVKLKNHLKYAHSLKSETIGERKENIERKSDSGVFEFFGKQIKIEKQPYKDLEKCDNKENNIDSVGIDSDITEFAAANVNIEKLDKSRDSKEEDTEESENQWNWEEAQFI